MPRVTGDIPEENHRFAPTRSLLHHAPMSLPTPKSPTRYQRVMIILDQAAGTSSSSYQGHGRFWKLPLPQLLELSLYGVRLIAPAGNPAAVGATPVCSGVPPQARPAGGCCHAPAPAPATAAPAVSFSLVGDRSRKVRYQFAETQGEHGYDAAHPLRNPDITEPSARQKLIIDPGPQSVSCSPAAIRIAQFAAGANPTVAQTFPPPLQPSSIETLGEIKVHQDGKTPNPNIYGPPPLKTNVSVQVPSWVIVGYPRYAPQVTDMVTLDDVAYDVAVRQFAFNPAMFSPPPFNPSTPSPNTTDDWANWRDLASWNPDYHPYFERDIWPILKRPSAYGGLMVFDGNLGGDPHNTGARGNFDRKELSIPPHEGETPGERRSRNTKRMTLYRMLRQPGQENDFTLHPGAGYSGPHPIGMPWLCGDNPLSNTAASKFLRLTDTMLFILHQWACGKFISADLEGFQAPADGPGVQLDRAALANGLGGSFCPGAEVSWIIRNPGIYSAPYRILPGKSYSAGNLSQASDMSAGLEPGDITKYSALPWQSDFNECSTQPIEITYRDWNSIDPSSTGDPIVSNMQTTFWWPAHRPMQITTPAGATYAWSGSIPQTPIGDLQMVTAWSTLDFIVDGAPAPK